MPHTLFNRRAGLSALLAFVLAAPAAALVTQSAVVLEPAHEARSATAANQPAAGGEQKSLAATKRRRRKHRGFQAEPGDAGEPEDGTEEPVWDDDEPASDQGATNMRTEQELSDAAKEEEERQRQQQSTTEPAEQQITATEGIISTPSEQELDDLQQQTSTTEPVLQQITVTQQAPQQEEREASKEGQLLTSGATAAAAQSKVAAKTWVWHPDRYWPSIFVAIFSRRSANNRRALLRDTWYRADYSQGKLEVRFALCENEDALQDSLLMENATYGDLLVMPCREGYGDGLLTRKTLAAMQEYQRRFSKSEMFMKIDDDTFAAWSRLWPMVAKGWENHTHHMYMGTLKPPSSPSRDPLNAFYEPESSFPREMYPRSADGGPGYLLGGELVKRMLNEQIPQKWVLNNEDKAVAVWVDELISLGERIEYINLQGQTGYAMTSEEWQGQLQWFHRGTWSTYPLLLHHRLSGEAISCLSVVEAKKDPQARIDHCFLQTDNTWIPTKFMAQAEGIGAELWLRRQRTHNGKRHV